MQSAFPICALKVVLLAAVLSLPACASLNMRLPEAQVSDIETERAVQSEAALALYQTHNARLQKIARPILTANAPLCADTRVDIGVQSAAKKQFPEDLREIAQRHLGLSDDPQIVFILDPKSELKIGDQFHVDGKAVSAKKAVRAQEAAKDVVVMRGEEQTVISLPETEIICDYPVILRYSPAINAYATGASIIVTTGMLDFASDAELALIIGHELAHNTQSHIRKIIQNRLILFGLAHATRQFESEADYVGLYYMARAGYNIDGAEQFWRRLATKTIKSLNKAKSHPVTPERYVRLSAAIDEIKAKQEAGEPLTPNSK